ncbi:MAG: hypothetical protein AAB364_01835 [Patescibacteria group bacterium]
MSKQDFKSLFSSVIIVSLVFSSLIFVSQVRAATQATTLTVTVNTALTFAIDNNGGNTAFGTITPGTPLNATTTLSVTTNNSTGWIVALSGDNKDSSNHNLKCASGGCTVGTDQITDQTEWVPGTATTSAGNAATIAALANSGNVLAFRVMSASSTNGTPFLATTWWGTSDCYTTSVAGCLWAGIASSTVSRTIGNAGAGSYSASAHLNTVQYYLNVGASQKTGAYTAPLTYTATAN